MQEILQKNGKVDWPTAIRRYRVEGLALNVRKFAYRFEVSTQTVYLWEGGKVQAPYRVTQEVAAWLLEGGPDA